MIKLLDVNNMMSASARTLHEPIGARLQGAGRDVLKKFMKYPG
jgi:hypothetical protein